MKQLKVYFICFLITTLVSGCAGYRSKTKDLTLILTKSEQTLNRLQEKIKQSTDSSLRNRFSQLLEKSDTLFPILKKCNEKYALYPEYIATLRETDNTLRALLKDYESISDKQYVINAITQDYDAKIQTIKNTAQNDATTKIKVIVNSNDEKGFFVFGKLSFEHGKDIKRYRFNQPTQNAVQDFIPGYYLLWLEKENRIGTPELHLIMSHSGEEEKRLVLQTPK